jgi:hypothetical protein
MFVPFLLVFLSFLASLTPCVGGVAHCRVDPRRETAPFTEMMALEGTAFYPLVLISYVVHVVVVIVRLS